MADVSQYDARSLANAQHHVATARLEQMRHPDSPNMAMKLVAAERAYGNLIDRLGRKVDDASRDRMD